MSGVSLMRIIQYPVVSGEERILTPCWAIHGHPHERGLLVVIHLALAITEMPRAGKELPRKHCLHGIIYCASLQDIFNRVSECNRLRRATYR